ncbi:MAG TPA: S9 family peptidase [Gemmatimonadetes bacterium]|nr:S9 family peptidase [Gemmatimonadota bacterium]
MRGTAMRTNTMILAAAFGLLVAMPVSAQEKPILTQDHYDKWERLGAAVLSPNGAWMAVSIRRVSEEEELRIHSTTSDSVVIVPFGSRAVFSSDNRWVAYSIGRSTEERDSARSRDEAIYDKLGLLNLETGEQTVRADFASFHFSDDGRYLALRRYKPKDRESDGVDVVVHDLLSDRDMSFGNVSEMAWQSEGSLLAMTTDAVDQVGNGVTVYDPLSGRIRSMDSDEATYRQLSWRDDSSDLVVYKTEIDEVFEDTAHVALVWRDIAGDQGVSYRLSSETNDAFPASMRIVEFRAPSWSNDGQTLFVGIQERRPSSFECEDGDSEEAGTDQECLEKEEEAAGVEIWHTLDRDPVPQQRVRERQLRRENYLSAWDLESGGFVQLGDDLTEENEIVRGGQYVIGTDETPYDEHAMFRQQFLDLYEIDVETGAKSKIADRISSVESPSLNSRYILWFAEEDWYSHDLEDGETQNITANLETVFVNLDVTPTREQMPSFGIAGWMEDGRSVLLNDQWDVWRVRLDGSGAERLTSGASQSIRYRIASNDLDSDDDGIGSDETIYYSVYSEWTKKAGFAGAAPGDDPQILVWEDKRFGGFSSPFLKADDADLFAFRMEGFDDSPDYFVAGPDLADPHQVTETNPFQSDYAWGRVELVDYENEWGRRLQGVLTYPANYDPSQSYPMIVYHYELLSQGMHQYQVPDPTQYYNQQIWSQDGYFVFRPDIVYRDRRPGQSNVETLRPAVAAALAQAPSVDEEKVGLIGHSWGGYQTTYFVTQDDLFASAVAGAPLTNLMSMYLSFYWNSGGTDARIFEISQGRMQVPWWEDWDSYEANSPIHHIQNMETPLLMMFGTNDGAVEYNQGVEFYNAARRLGKQMVMLSYDGENHGLAREPNQLDYQHRIMQWFGHYLKGEPAPDWISAGVPYVTQKDRLTVKRPVG